MQARNTVWWLNSSTRWSPLSRALSCLMHKVLRLQMFAFTEAQRGTTPQSQVSRRVQKGWRGRHEEAGCWRRSQLLMDGHQINILFISPTRGNPRVMRRSNKSILHVVIHCAKSHFSSMITFLCASVTANKKRKKKNLPI